MADHQPNSPSPIDYATPQAKRKRPLEIFNGLEPQVQTYLIIFALLMGLLVLTVLVAYVHLGPLNLSIALIIAAVKAVLVILFFMHVKEQSKLTWVFSSAAFLWLVIMLAFTFSDYLTRPHTPNTFDREPHVSATRVHQVPTPP
jgi:cytochrome c oxidase subunit IV